jgi:hypothetical protein
MELPEILSLKRPTQLQDAWLPEVISWLPKEMEAHTDEAGNIQAISVGVGHSSTTLYSCHLDTVHQSTGRQVLMRGERAGTIETSTGECLGADDGAGIWLLLEMIEAAVPGTYLFHLGEEFGCLGSRWMATHRGSWLDQFQRAISFDRPGTTDVVTHLSGERSCSPGFALALSLELSLRMPGYFLTPCHRGGPTDIKNYIGLIPECTNVSTGYSQQHSPRETQDVSYLESLRDAIVDLGGRSLLSPACA